MNKLVAFFLANRRVIGFGMLLTFFSSYGQTFLISLFAPQWREKFGLSSAGWGTLYSVATASNALLLPWVGGMVDKVNLRRYTLAVVAGLGSACVLTSLSVHWLMLGVCLFGLRLTGQGLCGHIAGATMARGFKLERGRALSLSSLGFALGEGVLPSVVVFLIGFAGWRTTWLINAAMVGFVLLPGVLYLLRFVNCEAPASLAPVTSAGLGGLPVAEKEWTRSHVLKDWRFYLLMPGHLVIPFTVTGLFIHQGRLAGYKGWDLSVMAFALVGWAVVRILCSLGIGPLIDRWGARRIFPFISLPMALGIYALTVYYQTWSAWVYLSLAGASVGSASSVGIAMWSEMYGTKHIGAIKSLTNSAAIFGTALSPFLFGALLDLGVSFFEVLVGSIGLALVGMMLSLPVCFAKDVPANAD